MAAVTKRAAIAGMLPEEIAASLQLDAPYKGRQIFKWISRGVASFDEMTDLSKALREKLAQKAVVRSVSAAQRLERAAGDGTVKLQLRLHDGAMVESVIMTDGNGRRTVCVSSEAGCACACAFCMTGTLGLTRNLDASEIVEQFIIAEQDAGRSFGGSGEFGGSIDNMVLMGMGEPLLNLDNVRRALAVLTDERGRGLSLRRVTLSTCGIIDGIEELAKGGPHVRLAVSLTTADGELRERLMPMARDNPLPRLKDAIAHYAKASGRRVTLEAALLGGENTDAESARKLIGFASGLDVNINLIPWNAVPSLPFASPTAEEVRAFAARLCDAGLNVTVRASRGGAVAAACGQLGSKAAADNGGE